MLYSNKIKTAGCFFVKACEKLARKQYSTPAIINCPDKLLQNAILITRPTNHSLNVRVHSITLKVLLKVKYLIIIGIFVIVSWFIFVAIFISIPPQDPPPELIQKRVMLWQIADIIFYSGVSIIAFGLTLFGIRKIKGNAP